MEQPIPLSDIISIIALLVSFFALFISWRQFLRDQSHLILRIEIQDNIHTGPMFIVKAVNQGRRPITIIRADARVSSGKEYPVFDTCTTLNETETLEFKVPISGFFKSLSSGYYITAFELVDSTGKRHITKTRRLRRQVTSVLDRKVE